MLVDLALRGSLRVTEAGENVRKNRVVIVHPGGRTTRCWPRGIDRKAVQALGVHLRRWYRGPVTG